MKFNVRGCGVRLIIAVLAFFLMTAPAMAQTPEFAHDIDDLPIMAGLSDTGTGYVFQVASGRRLAEVQLRGMTSADEIEAYYQSVLPSLGWVATPEQSRRYTRERETLRLVIGTAADGATVVRFLLSPTSGK